MPTLHRTLQRLSQHANFALAALLREQEVGGEYALEHFEIMFDQSRSGFVCMTVEFKGKQIWRKMVPVKGLGSDGVDMADDKLRDTITNTMRSHLNLVAQMHFARLDQLFPGSIDDVTMGYNPERAEKTIHVRFKNGHLAEGPEHEAKQDIFLARCMMLYNLPPI